MNIIYHHRTRAKNAEGVHVREIIKAMRNKSHNVFVVAPSGVDTFEHETITNIEKNSCLWDFVSRYMPQIGFEFLEIFYNIVVFFRFIKILKKKQIDFVYERYAFFGWMGACLTKIYKVPFLLEVNEISGLKRTRGQVLVGLSNWMEKKIFQKADAIIVVSDFLKKLIILKGIPANKIFVIPNGVDINKFNSDINVNAETLINGSVTDKVILGFVGNFVKWHNFDFLLNTFKEINENGNLILLLVGDGPVRNEIENLIQKNNLKNYVIITGSVNHTTVPEYIQLMDICIIPHSNEFRSPIKMFEYMAMGKPVIAPKVAPIEQVICSGINGLLFIPNDKCSFCKCLFELIGDPKKRIKLGDNAKKDILSNYLWQYNVNKVFSIVIDITRK